MSRCMLFLHPEHKYVVLKKKNFYQKSYSYKVHQLYQNPTWHETNIMSQWKLLIPLSINAMIFSARQPKNQAILILTDMRRLYSSSLCLLEAMKSPPFWIQPVWRPVSSSRSLLITFLVWAKSSTSTSLGRSCHNRPRGQTRTSRWNACTVGEHTCGTTYEHVQK